MARNKRKGYVVERKIRLLFEKYGWRVVRAGGSLGEADLVCVRKGKCIFLQVKSSKKDKFYYYGHRGEKLEGIPFYLVVDFGYGRVRITKPLHKADEKSGQVLEEFLRLKS